MDINTYVMESANTQADPIPALLRTTQLTTDLVHIGFGLSGEVGEFVDSIKKHLFYGKDLDRVNLIEELGDIAWFWAYACRVLEVDPEKVLQINIDKLKLRYPEKFSEEKALNRNLFVERELLEGGG